MAAGGAGPEVREERGGWREDGELEGEGGRKRKGSRNGGSRIVLFCLLWQKGSRNKDKRC